MASSDVGFGQAEDLGDFGVREAVEVEEDQGSIELRELGYGGVELVEAIVVRDRRGKIGECDGGAAGAGPIERAVERDTVDEGLSDRRGGSPKGRGGGPGGDRPGRWGWRRSGRSCEGWRRVAGSMLRRSRVGGSWTRSLH